MFKRYIKYKSQKPKKLKKYSFLLIIMDWVLYVEQSIDHLT